MDANGILNSVRDTYKYTSLNAVEMLPSDYKVALKQLELDDGTCAYYTQKFTNVVNKEVCEWGRSFIADVIIGFVAKENTIISIEYGPINIVKNLSAGEFMFALSEKVAPLRSTVHTQYILLNVTGSVYAVCGILNSSNRKIITSTSVTLHKGYYVKNGMVHDADSSNILNNIRKTCNYMALKEVETLPLSNLEAMRNCIHTGKITYYANKFTNFTGKHICNTDADVIIGFVAKENTTISIQYGPINIVKNLSAGEFMYARHETIVPLILSIHTEYSILNVSGSVYAVYAILNTHAIKNISNSMSEKVYIDTMHYLQNGELFSD